MAHRFLISQDSPVLYITLVTNKRLPVFRTSEIAALVCKGIDEARSTLRFLLFAYVVMLDHIHLLTSKPTTTSDILREVKSKTARRVIDYLKANNFQKSLAKIEHKQGERNYRYSLWQREKNVLPLFSERVFMEKLNYIHENPVRAGLVKSATEYPWSSARIWAGCQSEDEPLSIDKDLIYWRRSGRW